MSSGYFPLPKNGESGKKLVDANLLIREVIDKFQDDVYSGIDGQFDNSASDGGSLALLELACTILENQVS